MGLTPPHCAAPIYSLALYTTVIIIDVAYNSGPALEGLCKKGLPKCGPISLIFYVVWETSVMTMQMWFRCLLILFRVKK